MIRSLFIALLLFTFAGLSLPEISHAQLNPIQADQQINSTDRGFIPCSGVTCSACDLVALANTIIDWLIGLLAIIFAIVFVYSGFRLATSGGNESAKSEAKSKLTNALIGFLIVIGAWLLIDTLMRTLVGQSGQVGNGPWGQIECFGQVTSQVVTFDEDSQNYYLPSAALSGGTGSGTGGGSCSPLTSGVCSPGNLQRYFGSRANEASQICNKESGGRVVVSQTDKCADGNSFSGGIFQINIISNANLIPGCDKSQLVENPSASNGGIGACAVPRVQSSNGVVYCPQFSCRIKSQAMYNTCMQAVRDSSTNLRVAQTLFNQSGFDPWRYSRNACGITN